MKQPAKNNDRVNPFDLGSVAKITQASAKNVLGPTRNADTHTAASGRNGMTERSHGKAKR